MKTFIVPLVGMAMAAVPALALPGNCVTGTYTSYIALGSTGCQDGDATFSNFSSLGFVNIGIANLPSDQLQVIPGGTLLAPTLTFVYLNAAGAPTAITVNASGEQFAMGFSYQMTLTGATLADIQMNSNFGNTSPGSASATKNAQLQSGGTVFTSTVNDQGISNALGNHTGAVTPTSGTGVWIINDATSLQAQVGGSVTQANLGNLFTLAASTGVPETSTVLTIGTGLLCLGLIGKRRARPRN